MSYHVFFDFSVGLKHTIQVPVGTQVQWNAHVREIEATLGLKRVRYEQNPWHWDYKRDFSHVTDEALCETVSQHNRWVMYVHKCLEDWSQAPPKNSEPLTPEDAQLFWPGLSRLAVPTERWTAEYYKERMDCLYAVMRGRETEGVSLDVKALTVKQAAAVARLFAEFLDPGDNRLDVPHGHDYLASSYDGGYYWCAGEDAKPSGCYRAVHPDDIGDCRRRKCPLKEEDE